MKNLAFIFLFLLFSKVIFAQQFSDYEKYPITKTKFKFIKVTKNLNYPWGMTFIDSENLLITEKNGKLLKVNVNSGKVREIKHNIQSIKYNGNSIAFQQGGLLDVYYHNDGHVYFSYSHDYKETVGADNKPSRASSTAIARGKLIENQIKELKVLFLATPKQYVNKHFGSRITIKDNYLYASVGERNQGMIAQDPKRHPGSIIRIHTDGSIPIDNPKFKTNPDWLPEIYQIGLRNPQGMAISPNDNNIYFSNHGPMGGDSIGIVNYAGNYGWKDIAWGGTEYTGFKIGKVPFKNKYDKHVITWVPSMAVGNFQFYKGQTFPEWNGDLIGTATKAEMIYRLDFEQNKIVHKEIILKDRIGRIRDIEIDSKGDIYVIVDDEKSALWKITNQ